MKLFSIDGKDIVKGLIVALFTGALLPLSIIIQDPNFSVATVNWNAVLTVGLNGAVVGFISYMTKNFLSDSSGKFVGKIG